MSWEVITGDNREILPTLDRVDHVITDPPYLLDFSKCVTSNSRSTFINVGGEKRRGQKRAREIGYAAFDAACVAAIGPHLGRLAKRWCLVWHDAESGHLWRQAIGLKHVRTGMWCRSNPCPQFTGDRPAMGFELFTIQHGAGRLRWNGGGKAASYHHAQLHGSNTSERVDHPTPKPLNLMLDLVADFTDPGDLVLDPFCGSGTTGVACLRLGRRFIGIEKKPEWAELARDRLRAEEANSTLHALRSGQGALFG